jgi:uncharacterized protein
VTTEIVDKTGRFIEEIAPGAFTASIQKRPRVPLRAQHDGTAFPVGSVDSMTETGRGLEIVATIAETPRGDEALALLRQGIISGLSIGARIVKSTKRRDGSIVVTELDLVEISLVDAAAYPTAQVETLRSLDAMTARLDALHSKPNLGPAAQHWARLRLINL